METVACNLCGSTAYETQYEMRDWSFIQRDLTVPVDQQVNEDDH